MESIVGYRLAPRQRHLWALLQDPAFPARDARALLRLRGPVDADALAAALDALVARHEVLRTSFERLPGMPEALQVVEERGLRHHPAEDLRALSPDQRAARIDALWSDDGDLAGDGDEDAGDGALPDARLVRTGDDEHLLRLRVHPLAVDGASWENLAADLAALYAAETGGEPVEGEPVPYLAVSEWLNEVATSDEAQAGRAFWIARCQAPAAPLPVEPDAAPGEWAAARRPLSPESVAALDAFAAEAGVSSGTVVLAAWCALLHRLGGGASIRVGVPHDGRGDDELRAAVGPFAQHLPLTATVDSGLSFRALAERLSQACDEGAGWQECFDGPALHRFLDGDGAAPDATLRLGAGFSTVPRGAVHAAGRVRMEVTRRRVAEDPFDLHLSLEGDGAGTALELRGNAVSAPRLARLLERADALLADALARPDAPLGVLAVMSAAEQARVLDGANSSPSSADDGDADETVLDGFAAQAARTPDAAAVRFGDDVVSYAELDRRSWRLARALRERGVTAETRVGIMLPPSPDRVVAVLAVMRAGGAYVPLDPAYPPERLAFMAADAGLPLVLTLAALRERVPAVAGLAVAALDEEAGAVTALGDGPLDVAPAPESAAYVIYTSGSTGTPRGVVVEHRALAAHAHAVVAHYGLSSDDRVLQFASFNFDPSIEQTLPPLLAGACVVLRRDEVLSAEEIGRLVEGAGITLLNLPTAQWHLLAGEWARGEALPDLRTLRLVIAGGEAMLPAYVERWRATPAAGVRLLNAYGPTEAVVTATAFEVPAGFNPPDTTRSVPIGTGWGRRAAYVLDARLRPVPIGVAGELFLGGPALARGYLGRAALTAERFVPDPFGGVAGARLYRTGDRARREDDGTLVFIGRVDQQVKVRGFRIEPGEVEAALERHPGIGEAVVIPREDTPGETRLAAYVVGANGATPDAAALRAHLLGTLPEYMVPAAFVTLERLPLTPSGKVDRGALPAPGRAGPERDHVAPRNRTEELLAGIFAQVLKRDRVGIHDPFFELGGDSIISIQVVARARAAGLHLAPRQVFEHPTVAELAEVCGEVPAAAAVEPAPTPTQHAAGHPPGFPLARLGQAQLDAVIAGRSDVEDVYPLSSTQEGILFHALYTPGDGMYVGQFCYDLEGELDVVAFARAWRGALVRHPALRTGFVWNGVDAPVQVVSRSVDLPLVVEDWRAMDPGEQEARRQAFLAADRTRGFDLREPPLLRLALFRTADHRHHFVCTQHHLVVDGWSLPLLFGDVAALYDADVAGRAARLPPARRYRDFVAWLQGRQPEQAERFWRESLDGVTEATPLGVDGPGVAEDGYGRETLRLPPEALARLEALARGNGLTVNTVLQGAWALLLARYSGRDDVMFGATLSGRPPEVEGVEEMVGLFINTLPVRVRVPGQARVLPWLRQLQAWSLGLHEHQATPLTQVQAWSGVPAGAPMFDSIVVFQNYPVGDSLGGGERRVRVASRGVDVRTNYPLTLIASTVDGLMVHAVHRRARLEGATVRRMLDHLARILERFAHDAASRLADVPLMDPEERRRVVEAWNQTDRRYPRGVCLHDLFAEQVRARPDAEALVWGDERLSYAELDVRANRLARHFARHRVGPDARVGVLLERGMEMIVSILAIVKAGGCYVPLDPSYPPERLRMMLADAGARVLVTRTELAGLVEAADVASILIDQAADALAGESADAPESGVSAGNLVYIVYTSGSTGRPKGVMVSHQNVVQLVRETDYVQLGPGDRVAQASNASFDALAFEMWGALLNGATLVGISKETLLSPPALRDVLRDERITTLYQTTALLNQLSREEPGIFAPLREVLFGGQAADAGSVRRILKSGKPRRLLHMYGPTETTAWCSWEQVEELDDDALTVSVGRPTGNQRIYLLDSSLHPVAVGVPGEAYVGGDGVVRGYLDRPGLTAERFVPDPFSAHPGARMYRTG
ncbi:MAG TPA: amino acid adenylation domain-containing protein, partial [Longimicrobium sp.]|nr:amino acid adenylation domain-containing protein [Longimicrobium sp.]